MASIWRGLSRIGPRVTAVGPRSLRRFGTSVNNRVTTNASEAPSDSRIIVISGPSGKLFDAHPDTFAFTVSHTTRAPRPCEIEGTNYFFVNSSKFADLVSQGAFVEHAKFGGNQYGTSQQTISDQIAKGRVVVLDIEMDGVKQMKANPSIDARYIFISPPNFEALAKRLRGRGTEKDEAIQKRLAQAKAELDYAQTGAHDKIIVNDDLQVACKELEDFIFLTGS
ncbi:guanylate kinase [Penicillium longicatenatum]|uniref:guanylate kinase n=1 Tax=Penicillium longicatenatum TaxID=1561947 RepID=UPI0025487185|nr:guanylate kinase [Penicillium longicatenatum]KAJ5636603.1 guanylate kinase [Penicillium longicatenatum]